MSESPLEDSFKAFWFGELTLIKLQAKQGKGQQMEFSVGQSFSFPRYLQPGPIISLFLM